MKTGIPLCLRSQEGCEICSRRNFLKLGATALGAAALPSIVGCGPVKTGDECLKDILATPHQEHPRAFEASSIGTVKLKNRILRSAVTMNGVDAQGRPKETLLAHYAGIARGGAGAIITGMVDTGMMIDDIKFKV